MRLVLIIFTACLAIAGSFAFYGPLGTAYGALCAVCFWAVWRDADWRAAGAALGLSWVISNLICVIGNPPERPAVFSGAEMLVLMSAFVCWFSGRYTIAARMLAVVSFVSIACNVLLAGSAFEWADIHAHEVRTNIAFAVECLIVGFTGMRERGYFDRLFSRRGHSAANHVHAQKASEQ
jgi:hypothetical protein